MVGDLGRDLLSLSIAFCGFVDEGEFRWILKCQSQIGSDSLQVNNYYYEAVSFE